MKESAARAEIFKHVAMNPEEALLLAQQHVGAHPESAEAMLILADLYFLGLGAGRESARPLYEKVLLYDPNNPGALTGLALVPGVDAEQAITLLKKVTAIVGNALTYMNLGYKSWELGRYTEAQEAFEHLLNLARDERNQDLASSAGSAIRRIRDRQPPTNYSYVLPE